MKSKIVVSGMITLTACLLSGCGQSSTSSSENANPPSAQPSPTASTPAPNAPAPPGTRTPEPVAAAPTPIATQPAAANTATALTPSGNAPAAGSEAASQFASNAAAQTDKTAASIGSELADKVKALTQSAPSDTNLKTQLGSALQSLSSGKEASGLSTLFQQAKQANLTPQQTQLAKEIGNLGSAYVVQRNFSSVDGAQGDVATIVNSLRKGSITPAVPALQSLAQNASLTAQQKDLLSTVADQYAPGLKKTTDSLKQGLQSLQGFGK